ncbi:MAG: zinc ribbon domain-containing protein [Candidatus Binatia bacterium]|nr:zinc ribbon domain-containing protein [Candidatus Binatia bacterium]
MPIYEYRCRDCQMSFEHLTLSTKGNATCPKCHSRRVERRLSVFSSPGNGSVDGGGGRGCGCNPSTCGCH